jgi:hypothetical protein
MRERMGLLSGDWRRDYRHLVGAVERDLGPLAVGCFCELTKFRSLEVDSTPGAWARAVVVRDLVISPLPAPLAVPLAVDAARATVAVARQLVQGFDPMGLVLPLLRKLSPPPMLQGREAREANGAPFHPLEVLRKLLSR